MPIRATDQSAGYDLLSTQHIEKLRPMHKVTIETGLTLTMPPNYTALITTRSGLAKRKGLIVLNSPGIIDADYEGTLKVILLNTSQETIEIKLYERIAQLLLVELPPHTITSNYPIRVIRKLRSTQGLGSTDDID